MEYPNHYECHRHQLQTILDHRYPLLLIKPSLTALNSFSVIGVLKRITGIGPPIAVLLAMKAAVVPLNGIVSSFWNHPDRYLNVMSV